MASNVELEAGRAGPGRTRAVFIWLDSRPHSSSSSLRPPSSAGFVHPRSSSFVCRRRRRRLLPRPFSALRTKYCLFILSTDADLQRGSGWPGLLVLLYDLYGDELCRKRELRRSFLFHYIVQERSCAIAERAARVDKVSCAGCFWSCQG